MPAPGEGVIDSAVEAAAARGLAALEGNPLPAEPVAAPAAPEPVAADAAAEHEAPAPVEKPRGEDGKFVPKAAAVEKIKFSNGQEHSLAELEAIAAGKPAIEALQQSVKEQAAGVQSLYEKASAERAEAKRERAEAERMKAENETLRQLLIQQDENGGTLDMRQVMREAQSRTGKPVDQKRDVELTEEELDARIEKRVSDLISKKSQQSRAQYVENQFGDWVTSAIEANPILKPRAAQYGWTVTGELRKDFIENKIDPTTLSDSQYQAMIRSKVADLAAAEARIAAEQLGATLEAHQNGKKDLPVTPRNAGTGVPQKPPSMSFDYKKAIGDSRNMDEYFDKIEAQLKTTTDELDRLQKTV